MKPKNGAEVGHVSDNAFALPSLISEHANTAKNEVRWLLLDEFDQGMEFALRPSYTRTREPDDCLRLFVQTTPYPDFGSSAYANPCWQLLYSSQVPLRTCV